MNISSLVQGSSETLAKDTSRGGWSWTAHIIIQKGLLWVTVGFLLRAYGTFTSKPSFPGCSQPLTEPVTELCGYWSQVVPVWCKNLLMEPFSQKLFISLVETFFLWTALRTEPLPTQSFLSSLLLQESRRHLHCSLKVLPAYSHSLPFILAPKCPVHLRVCFLEVLKGDRWYREWDWWSHGAWVSSLTVQLTQGTLSWVEWGWHNESLAQGEPTCWRSPEWWPWNMSQCEKCPWHIQWLSVPSTVQWSWQLKIAGINVYEEWSCLIINKLYWRPVME